MRPSRQGRHICMGSCEAHFSAGQALTKAAADCKRKQSQNGAVSTHGFQQIARGATPTQVVCLSCADWPQVTKGPNVWAQEMLGDEHNLRVLRKTIQRFISLRRYESMSLHQAVQGLRVSGLPFLFPPSRAGAPLALPFPQPTAQSCADHAWRMLSKRLLFGGTRTAVRLQSGSFASTCQ